MLIQFHSLCNIREFQVRLLGEHYRELSSSSLSPMQSPPCLHYLKTGSHVTL